MKIAFTGAFHCGRTTLANELSKILGIPAETESKPTLAANLMGYKKASDVPKELLMVRQYLALVEQIKSQSKPSYVNDRSVLEYYSFFMHDVTFKVKTHHYEEYKSIIRANMNYDHLIFVPTLGGKIEDNGMRNLGDPRPYEEGIKYTIKDWGLNVQQLKSKTLEGRIAEVLKIVGA